MSYCLNPSCPSPADQKTPDPLRAKFCSNCGTSLVLGNRYRALNLIGQGNVGKTFVAVDEHRPSKPKCIIKQLIGQRSSRGNLDESTLFRQEAERLEKLGQHPQIPSLWAFFEQADHRYLIQEFIEGVSLEQQLQEQGAFSELQIRAVLNDVLPVLQFVHIHQIIHRDIKAQNLVYVPSSSKAEETPSLVLVDFGTAKFATASNLLQVGTMIGVEGYGPPEQAVGRATFSSDLYSLGVTCIHLLTNEPPTTLFNRQKQTWEWEAHVKGEVSGELSQILNQMLKRELRSRYKAANEVLDDVNRTLSGVSSRPTLVPSPARRSPPPRQAATPSSPAIAPSWRCLHTLKGHQAWVRSVMVSPNGNLLASGSGDKTVKLWSVARGQLLHTLTGHSTWVRGVAVSPDQRLVASVSNDKTIRLWHPQTGTHYHTLAGHTDWIRAVTFLPLEHVMATAGQDKLIHLWDLKRNAILRTLKGHDHWVLCVAAHPEGRLLFTGSRDRTIRCWNVATGKCEKMLLGHTSEISALAVSPDGTTLISGSADQTVRLWDIQAGKLVQTLRSHGGAVNSVAFHPNGQEFASGSSDKTIKLWQLGAESPSATLTGHAGWVWSVSFPSQPSSSEHGIMLASGSWDGTINLWKQE